MARQIVFIGTELKLNVNIEPMSGATMDDYDFDVELICGSFKKSNIVINKEQTKRVDSNNYIVCFDTTEIGTGMLKCRVVAYIPDGDFKDGKRTEVTEIETGIEIVKSL
jgi:hypothetical protein